MQHVRAWGYQPLHVIATGSYATVHRAISLHASFEPSHHATSPNDKEDVAIKFFDANNVTDKSAEENASAEYRAHIAAERLKLSR